jgi:hypothetical protein
METKVNKIAENQNGTIGHYWEETERVKAAVLSTLAKANLYDGSGDTLFDAHADLLPRLFSGWMASDECVSLPAYLRAQVFGEYNQLVTLLAELDETLNRLPIEILKSVS